MIASEKYNQWRSVYHECQTEKALKNLYNELQPSLYSILTKNAKEHQSINGYLIEDIIQEVFSFFADIPEKKLADRQAVKRQKMPVEKATDLHFINKVKDKLKTVRRTAKSRNTVSLEQAKSISNTVLVNYSDLIPKIQAALIIKNSPKKDFKAVFDLWLDGNRNKKIATILNYSEAKVSTMLTRHIQPLLETFKKQGV